MRLIDADAYRDEFMQTVYEELADDHNNYRANRIIDKYDSAPTVDAVPSTDVDELKMRLIGAEAAINGMREQINRMVIINSEKVSVVRCKDCRWYDKVDWCNKLRISGVKAVEEYWFCAEGEEDETD